MGASLLSDVGSKSISFSGEVAISTICQTYERLAALLNERGDVVIDVEDLTEADLAFIQLLESARRKAGKIGVGFSLSKPATGSLLEVLRRGGFLDDETSDRATFWLQGAAQ